MVRVVVAQTNALRLVVHAGLFQVVETSLGCRLPNLFELVDLLRAHLTRALDLFIQGHFHQPRQKTAVINERLPGVHVPGHVFEATGARARITAQQHDDTLRLRRNETQQKHVAAAAIVALENGLTERTVGMELHLLMLGAHQMRDNVGTRGVAA